MPHPTTTGSASVTATVDLGAISANLDAMRSLLPDGCGMMPAVKANAYGHGAVMVAQHLERTGTVRALAVATLAEGIELREAGIALPILKLSHCFDDELSEAVEAGLWLTVVDESTLRAASAAATARGAAVGVHLKLDTGMGRIGAPADRAVELARLARDLPAIELVGIFTHLPVSDVADDGGYTAEQLAGFRAAVDAVAADSGPVRWVHAANSGAILGHDLDGFTLARPGIAMYGHYPDSTTPHSVPLRPAMRVATRLSFRKWVTTGTSVGYGRTWVAERDTWIGTVPLGYADGFSRLNSNRGHLLVGGRRVPVVGRVCMDQCMVDLGPDSADAIGDEVVMIGRQGGAEITADEVAELMGTISYEVTCLLAPRVRRVYTTDPPDSGQ